MEEFIRSETFFGISFPLPLFFFPTCAYPPSQGGGNEGFRGASPIQSACLVPDPPQDRDCSLPSVDVGGPPPLLEVPPPRENGRRAGLRGQ